MLQMACTLDDTPRPTSVPVRGSRGWHALRIVTFLVIMAGAIALVWGIVAASPEIDAPGAPLVSSAGAMAVALAALLIARVVITDATFARISAWMRRTSPWLTGIAVTGSLLFGFVTIAAVAAGAALPAIPTITLINLYTATLAAQFMLALLGAVAQPPVVQAGRSIRRRSGTGVLGAWTVLFIALIATAAAIAVRELGWRWEVLALCVGLLGSVTAWHQHRARQFGLQRIELLDSIDDACESLNDRDLARAAATIFKLVTRLSPASPTSWSLTLPPAASWGVQCVVRYAAQRMSLDSSVRLSSAFRTLVAPLDSLSPRDLGVVMSHVLAALRDGIAAADGLDPYLKRATSTKADPPPAT